MEDALDVGFSGVAGDAKGATYLFVAHTLGNQFYDLKLAQGEALKWGAAHGLFQPPGPLIGIFICRRWPWQFVKRIVRQARLFLLRTCWRLRYPNKRYYRT
jgi:hypothetical protein